MIGNRLSKPVYPWGEAKFESGELRIPLLVGQTRPN